MLGELWIRRALAIRASDRFYVDVSVCALAEAQCVYGDVQEWICSKGSKNILEDGENVSIFLLPPTMKT